MKLLFSGNWLKITVYFVFAAATIGANLYASIALGDFVNGVIAKSIEKSYLSLVFFVVFQIVFRAGNFFGDWVYRKIQLSGTEQLFLKKLQAGKKMEVAWNESNKYFGDYVRPLFWIIHSCLGIFGSIGAIAVISWPVALVALIGFLIAYAASLLMKGRLASANKKELDAENAFSLIISKMEANMPSFGDHGKEARLAEAPLLALRDATRRKEVISTVRNSILNFATGGLYVAIVVATAFLINRGQSDIGTLVVLGAVSGTIYGQVSFLSENFAQVRANRWVARISDVPVISWVDAAPPTGLIKEIKAVKVGKTINGRTIFSHISFDLSAEDKLRIKGANGSGKSTLARILCGIDSVYEGQITQSPAPRADYESMPFFYQTSDSKLLNGTVKQNITCFADSFDEELLLKVTENLHLTDLLDRDVNSLSSGEKSLVKIAMTVFSRMSVKIYDELFVNVDANRRDAVVSYVLQTEGISVVVAHHGVKQDFTKTLIIKKAEQREKEIVNGQ